MAMTRDLKPVHCLLILASSAVAVNFPDSLETFIFSGILILILMPMLIIILIYVFILIIFDMLMLIVILIFT